MGRRWAHLDSDDERTGMTCVGYDADTQVYTYRDGNGSLYETPPGSRYGEMRCVWSPPAAPDKAEREESPDDHHGMDHHAHDNYDKDELFLWTTPPPRTNPRRDRELAQAYRDIDRGVDRPQSQRSVHSSTSYGRRRPEQEQQAYQAHQIKHASTWSRIAKFLLGSGRRRGSRGSTAEPKSGPTPSPISAPKTSRSHAHHTRRDTRRNRGSSTGAQTRGEHVPYRGPTPQAGHSHYGVPPLDTLPSPHEHMVVFREHSDPCNLPSPQSAHSDDYGTHPPTPPPSYEEAVACQTYNEYST